MFKSSTHTITDKIPYICKRAKYRPDTRDWDIAEYYEKNPHYTRACVEIISETLGQYTGIKDKNGKKIFEGDILRSDDLYDEPLLVIFNDSCGAFQILLKDGYSEGFLEHYSDINHLEVIGNIHDNPELLNRHYKKDGIAIEYHYDEHLKGD